VLCRSPYEGAAQACSLLSRDADAISSHFFVGYGAALKMLRVRSPDECRRLVSRSFGSFIDSSSRDADRQRLLQLERERAGLRPTLSRYPAESVASFMKLGARLAAEERALRYLEQQAAAESAELVETLLGFVQMGTLARLHDGAYALCVDDAPEEVQRRLRERAPKEEAHAVLLVLGDGSLRVACAKHIADLFPETVLAIPAQGVRELHAALPSLRQWRCRSDGVYALDPPIGPSATLGQLVPDAPSSPSVVPAAVSKQLGRVAWARAQVEAHALHGEADYAELLRAGERDALLADQGRKLARKLGGRGRRAREVSAGGERRR